MEQILTLIAQKDNDQFKCIYMRVGGADLKTGLRDNVTPATFISPAGHTSVGLFRTVLKNRSFLLLWLAQLLSQTVFNAANYGVIAIVTAVTHSTVMVGVAIISFTLPAVPFSLLAGVYVDYLNKRLVLWVSNALRAVATGLLVVALLWNPHTVIPLYVLAFVISLVTQFITLAEASAIPLLVSKHDLVPALSLFNITLTIAQALGFLVLGGLFTALIPPFHLSLGSHGVQVQSFDVLFALVALVYLICSLLILAIPTRALQHKQGARPGLPRSFGKQAWNIIRHDVRETWGCVRQDRQLLLALLRISFVSILLLVIGELAGPFVVTVLHLPVQALPLILSACGSWPDTRKPADALSDAPIGQKPHHRSGRPWHRCRFDFNTPGALHPVAARALRPGYPLVCECDHVCHRGSAGHGEYSRANGDAGASPRRGARPRVLLPVDVV